MMAFRCIVTTFLNILFIYRNTGQQLPAYITENSPGCINTSVTSWNITENFLVHLKKDSIIICTLAGIPGGDPYIGINKDYRDRISCGIDVNQKQTFICFTNAVNISDAGVQTAHLSISSTVYNNTLYVMRPPTKPVISLQGDLINQMAHNLSCSAASTSVPVTGLLMTYSWTDNGAAITDPRFTLSGQGNNVLMINRVRKEDTGKKIQCRATEDRGISSDTSDQTILDVLYKPEVSTTTSSPYMIVEGQTATMKCNVTAANPNTDIRWSWIKADSPSNAFHTGPTYTISSIQRNQSGTYNCSANNSIGMSTPATIQVDVQYKPEVITSISSPYKVVEGETATMTCSVTTANPNTDIRWSWIKTDSPSNVLHTDSNYTISNIQRNKSGTYNCRANNSIGMSTPATVQVDVEYGPASVIFSPDIMIINKTENQTAPSVYCSAVCNPNCTYQWTGVTNVNSGVLDLKVLKRTMRGDYTCTASNTIKSISRPIRVYVNYPPTTEVFKASGNKIYEEASPFNITCEVDSYPFSDINILNIDTGEIKASGGPVESLTYSESSAKCYHTASYTCSSKNSYGSTSSTVQRIFIYCNPRPFDGQSNINTGIKTNEGLNISATFIAYPPPVFSWKFRKNLTDANKTLTSEFQMSSVTLNVSTIQAVLTKKTLNQEEFGYYTVTATNPTKPSQISIITYHVIPERKPNPPYNISINCEISRGTAIVNWTPGFDGGAEQTFLVSYRTSDGDEQLSEMFRKPNATITGLNDDTLYYFKVIASNTNGKTLSEEEESCKTQEQINLESNNSLPLIAGGAAGGLAFAVLIVIGILFLLRRMNSKEEKNDLHESKSALNEDTEEEDGVKDNVLYISAGPRDDDIPGVSGVAVYAEVNKKGSASDSNANVYAEVQKSEKKGKGLQGFKKEVKPKQKKEKKQKLKKETADVYENSEDIAMTQNKNDVYSNTAENNGTKSGKSGYKNQDGLLYVEVQFDQKQENGKPVIHGEEEKTDYATVEFPFPPSSKTDGIQE